VYQAIVFLPLLGFLLAGLISLAGARARFPGADLVAAEAGDDRAQKRQEDDEFVDDHSLLSPSSC